MKANPPPRRGTHLSKRTGWRISLHKTRKQAEEESVPLLRDKPHCWNTTTGILDLSFSLISHPQIQNARDVQALVGMWKSCATVTPLKAAMILKSHPALRAPAGAAPAQGFALCESLTPTDSRFSLGAVSSCGALQSMRYYFIYQLRIPTRATHSGRVTMTCRKPLGLLRASELTWIHVQTWDGLV